MVLSSSFASDPDCGGIEFVLKIANDGSSAEDDDSSFCLRRLFRFLRPIAVGSPPAFGDGDAAARIVDDEIPLAAGRKSSIADVADIDVPFSARSGDTGESEVAGILGKILDGKAAGVEGSVVVATEGCDGDGATSLRIPVRTTPRSRIANRTFLAIAEDRTAPMAAIECSPDMVQSHDTK